MPQKEHSVNKPKKHNKGVFGHRSSFTTFKTKTLLFVLIIAITLWRSHITWYWCLGSGYNKKRKKNNSKNFSQHFPTHIIIYNLTFLLYYKVHREYE